MATARGERFAVCVPNQTGGGGISAYDRMWMMDFADRVFGK